MVLETEQLKTTMGSLSFETVDSDECDNLQIQGYEKIGRNISSNIISKPGNYEDLHRFSKKEEEENTYEALDQEEENTYATVESTGEKVQKGMHRV